MVFMTIHMMLTYLLQKFKNLRVIVSISSIPIILEHFKNQSELFRTPKFPMKQSQRTFSIPNTVERPKNQN